MRRAVVALRVAVLVLGVALVVGTPAAAHDCASQSDCEQTTGYITGISVMGGIIAIITGILGTQLGGGLGGAVAGGAGGAVGGSASGAADPGPSSAPGDEGGGVAVAEPPPEEDELEVPWDELIEATEPPAGGEEGLPIDEPIEDLLGGGEEGGEGPSEKGGGEKGDGEGKPPVKGGVVTDPGEQTDKVKPPILDATEKVGEVAGVTKDAAERVGGWGEKLGEYVDNAKDLVEEFGDSVSEKTRKTLNETLDYIGEKAGHLKDVGEKVGEMAGKIKDLADKAAEYMDALNDNLERTEKMGLRGKPQEALGWWKTVWKAAGEAGQSFVDKVGTPVRKIVGDDRFHEMLPIKEFGEQMGDAPTSAAEDITSLQTGGQSAAEIEGATAKGDRESFEVDEIFPGRRGWGT